MAVGVFHRAPTAAFLGRCMSSRSRQPWSDDDYNILSDMLRDGFPRRAIAQKLGRSITAIQGIVRKLPYRMLRPQTKPVQIQVTIQHIAALEELAKRKGVTVPTLMRLIVELSIASPEWAEKLFDDDFEERHT
jgi:hypothetical protein